MNFSLLYRFRERHHNLEKRALTMMTLGPKPFDFKDEGNCAVDWQNWLRSFEIFASANQIESAILKRDWLLHHAGPKVQNIYFNLPEDTEEEKSKRCGPLITGFVPFEKDPYTETVFKLQNFFAPKRNLSYERHIFRKMKQAKNERIDSFVMKLRAQAVRCEFEANTDDNIKDQITTGCESNTLRRKILERGDDNLDTIMKIARVTEAVAEQQKEFVHRSDDSSKIDDNENTEKADVCRIDNRKIMGNRNNFNKTNSNIECARCGWKGHRASDDKCPAKGKTCTKCGKSNHFARKCRTKSNQYPDSNDSLGPPAKMKRENQPVQIIEPSQYKDYEDVFCDTTTDEANKIWCKVGGIEVKVVVDSGSKYNIVDRDTWTELKAKNVQTTLRQKEVDIGFVAYGGHPLKFLGMFEAIIQVADKQMSAKFYVANEFGKLLLGFETAMALNVLKIGHEINKIDAADGKLGKIKGVMVDITIKENAKPIQQPYRRIPAPLEKIVDDKISDLLKKGIIEKVDISNWISPLVVVPKDNGNDARICVDMKRANEVIAREKHPLPTIDDFLPELSGAKLFSKLDIKSAFHQVEF